MGRFLAKVCTKYDQSHLASFESMIAPPSVLRICLRKDTPTNSFVSKAVQEFEPLHTNRTFGNCFKTMVF
jgi:hypothetical protein